MTYFDGPGIVNKTDLVMPESGDFRISRLDDPNIVGFEMDPDTVKVV